MSDGRRNNIPVTATAWYAVVGVVTLLAVAMVRLAPYALEALGSGLSGLQMGILITFVVWMAWAEGYRGFQKRYSPRVVSRALALGSERPSAWTLVAPIVAMGLLRGSRKVLITSWALTAMIVVFIIALRFTPQPWRGIVDAGVVVGLAWGTTAIVIFWIQALTGSFEPVDDGGLSGSRGRVELRGAQPVEGAPQSTR